MILVLVTPYFDKGFIQLNWLPFTSYKFLGLVFEFAAAILAVSSLIAMKNDFEIRVEPKNRLVTSWPFSMVRNPIYLALVLFWSWLCLDSGIVLDSNFYRI